MFGFLPPHLPRLQRLRGAGRGCTQLSAQGVTLSLRIGQFVTGSSTLSGDNQQSGMNFSQAGARARAGDAFVGCGCLVILPRCTCLLQRCTHLRTAGGQRRLFVAQLLFSCLKRTLLFCMPGAHSTLSLTQLGQPLPQRGNFRFGPLVPGALYLRGVLLDTRGLPLPR